MCVHGYPCLLLPFFRAYFILFSVKIIPVIIPDFSEVYSFGAEMWCKKVDLKSILPII